DQIGPYGEVVAPGDVLALKSALEKVLRDRPRYQLLSAEMRAYAERKFNPAAMVQAHLDLYEQLLARPRHEKWRSYWLDPLVRLAIRAYWRQSPTAAKELARSP